MVEHWILFLFSLADINSLLMVEFYILQKEVEIEGGTRVTALLQETEW